MKNKLHLIITLVFVLMLTNFATAQKKNKNSGIDVIANTSSSNSSAVTLKNKETKAQKKYYDVSNKKYLKDWFLTVHFGTTTPFTDIRSYDWTRQTSKPSEMQWGAGLGLTKMFNSAFGLEVDYTLGRLLGRTVERGGFAEDRQYWKLLGFDQPVYFKTNIFHQGALNFYIDWLGMGNNYNKYIRSQITGKPVKARRVALYTKIGIGLIRVSSQIYNTKDDKPITNNQYLRGFTNKFTDVVFPLAFGMKFKVTKTFDLGFEGRFTFTNSDKLDALNFQSKVQNGITVGGFSKINRDAYAYLNVNFCYKFGRMGAQKEHVEWVDPIAFVMANQKQPKKEQPKELDLKDTDKDGVLDILDNEPITPEGYAVDAHGVTLDSDKDGCPDSKDPEPFSSPNYPIVNCKNVIPTPPVAEIPKQVDNTNSASTPDSGSALSNNVLPKIKFQKLESNDIWQLTSIYFDLNKYDISTAATAELKKVGLVMSTNPDLKVNVGGNTDTRGSVEYNNKLSENRVNAALKYLNTHYGIALNRFIKLPLGKSDPLVKDAESEDQHQVNRRVDFSPAE